MKNFTVYSILLLGISLFGACQKGEPLQDAELKSTIQLTMQGYIMQDTLEFIKDGQLFCEAAETVFKIKGNMGQAVVVSASDLYVRKKGSTEFIDSIKLHADAFKQTLRLFYDGEQLTNNIELTPVSSPDVYGIRFSWVGHPIYCKKTAVDIEISIRTMITDPLTGAYTNKYQHYSTVKNIGKDFSEFIELPKLDNSDPYAINSYVYKFFETGTKNYPFTKEVDFSRPIEDNYGGQYLTEGESYLLQIKTLFTDNYFEHYNIDDIAIYFNE